MMFEVGTAVFAFVSSMFWFWSAATKIPKLGVPFGGVFPEDHPWIVANNRMTKRNKWAALFAGLSALCAFLSFAAD